MDIFFKEKIAVCMTVCGPTYRKQALEKLSNFYPEADNVYYFVITDNKDFFKCLNKKNLIVKELKDFYNEYPQLEKNEAFINKEEHDDTIRGYGNKCLEKKYTYSFDLIRMHLKIAEKYDITNVAMVCSDANFHLDQIGDICVIPGRASNSSQPVFADDKRDLLYWDGLNGHYEGLYCKENDYWRDEVEKRNILLSLYSCSMKSFIVPVLDRLGLTCGKKVQILNGIIYIYSYKNLESMRNHFNVWNTVVETLYEKKEIQNFISQSWVVNNEFTTAPIHNALNFETRAIPIGWLTHLQEQKEFRPWTFDWPPTDQ